MEEEVKQLARRNRRRQRAQRMQAQAARDELRRARDADSGEDESPARDKLPRPRDKPRRRRSRDPLGEEDIIDGFAIMAFRTYEDLEAAIKSASCVRASSLTNKPRLLTDAPRRDLGHHHPTVNSHGITLVQDAGTSDDSGRASERLTGSSVAPRDPDSSRDRLSDASSRCSSGKGYICDSEGDDDKASPDNSRNASPRYHDPSPTVENATESAAMFRVTGGGAAGELAARSGSGGALALSRAPVGGSASPAPAPLPHPAPSPAPAALPPPAPPPPHMPPAAAPHRAHRSPSTAHIPSLEARTPAQAAPPDPPATDLQPSPTPAPPFPSHAAYPQAAAAPAAPHDYRNAVPRPHHHHHPPHPILPGHDVRPAYHTNGVAHPHALPGPPAPASPKHLPSRPYGAPAVSVPASINSTASTHPPYQSQPISSLKHPLAGHGRPTHAPFGAPNHLPPGTVSHSIAQHVSHAATNHSVTNHLPHTAPPIGHTIANHVASNHVMLSHPSTGAPPNSTAPFGAPTHATHRPPQTHPLHPSPASAPPAASTHSLSNSTDAPVVTSVTAPPPVVDTRPAGGSLSSGHASPAVATLAANGYAPPPPVYPPLYAPYATSLHHTHPYLPPSAASPRNNTDTRNSLSASPLVAPKTPKSIRPQTPGAGSANTQPPPAPALQPLPLPLPMPSQHVYSPRGHSPNRERDSYSSNISSLSRASGGTPVSYSSTTSASVTTAAVVTSSSTPSAPLVMPLVTPLATPTPTPAAPAAVHLTHSLAPVPTVPSITSAKPPAHWGVSGASSAERPHAFAAAPGAPLFTAPLPPPNPNPFSAESLFQTSPSADLLRRELDSRFLAAAGGALALRTEMHHHQHQHTHVHQHPPPHAQHAQLFLPPPAQPMDVKMSLYRHGLGLGYPYSSGLLHPGLSPSTPFMPPAPLSTFTPKPVVGAVADVKPPAPQVAKTGKWNAMHVRIAWEIYNHQQKGMGGGAGGGGAGTAAAPDKDKLRPNIFPPVSTAHVPSLSHAPPPPHLYRSPYEHLPPSPYLTHHPHLAGVSPFARYGAGAFPGAPPPFSLSPYASRDLALSSLHAPHAPGLAALHDAWRTPPRAPPPASAAAAAAAREHDERERARREREARERRDQEERERRKRDAERVRQRSPLRNGAPEVKEERKEAPRPPPLAYPPPPAWDPYRPYDLQHMRFPPIVEAAIRAEEDHRAKMLSAYAAHHQQLKGAPGLHRPLPPPHHAPPAHPVLAPLAPLPPLDLLKKEEPR